MPGIIYVIVDVPEIPIAAITSPDPSTLTLPLLVLHVPPLVASVSVTMLSAQILVVPLIAEGAAFTTSTADELQPDDTVYMIVAVPADAPAVTTPVVKPIVAAPVLLHVPPLNTSLSVTVALAHTERLPMIAPGCELTVTVAVV